MDSTIHDNLKAARELVAVAENLEAAPNVNLEAVTAKIESLEDQLEKATHLYARKALLDVDEGDQRALGLTPEQWRSRFADLKSRFDTALSVAKEDPTEGLALGQIIHATVDVIQSLEKEEQSDKAVLSGLRQIISQASKAARGEAFKDDVAKMRARSEELKKEPDQERGLRGDAHRQLMDMVKAYLPFDPGVCDPDIGAKIDRQTELVTALRAEMEDPAVKRAINNGEYRPEYTAELSTLNKEIRTLTKDRLKVLLPTVFWGD